MAPQKSSISIVSSFCEVEAYLIDQVKITPPKDTNKLPVTDPEDMGIYELCDKEFRIILLNNFNKLQEHRQLNEIWKIL